MDDKERELFEKEIAELKVKIAQLESVATGQAKLAEAYRAQINAIILILKSPI